MKFELELDCDNDAFADDPTVEVFRILKVARARLCDNDVSNVPVKLYDINGNAVGSMRFTQVGREST